MDGKSDGAKVAEKVFVFSVDGLGRRLRENLYLLFPSNLLPLSFSLDFERSRVESKENR